jgi:hypothetical protein
MLADVGDLALLAVPPLIALTAGVVGLVTVERKSLAFPPAPPAEAGDELALATADACQLGRSLISADYSIARIGYSVSCMSLGLFAGVSLRRHMFPESIVLHDGSALWTTWLLGLFAFCFLNVLLLYRAISYRKGLKRRFVVASMVAALVGPGGGLRGAENGPTRNGCGDTADSESPCAAKEEADADDGLHEQVAEAFANERSLFEDGACGGPPSLGRECGHVALGMLTFLWVIMAACYVPSL